MALTCRACVESLSDYRSGELDPKKHADCEAHLAGCPSCVEYCKSYEETVRLAKRAFSHPADTVSSDLPDELVRAILFVRPRIRR